MASKVEVKKKSMTKRGGSKGTLSKKKVSVKNTGKGNVNVAMVGKARKK